MGLGRRRWPGRGLLLALLALTAWTVAANRHPEINCYPPPGQGSPCEMFIKKKMWLGKVAEQYGAVTIADILALNPELEGNTTPANVTIQLPCQRPASRGDTVMDLLKGRPDMSILVRVVQSAGLEPVLADPGFSGTLLAPSNCYWKHLLADLDVTEAMLLQQSNALNTLVLYHIVKDRAIPSKDLSDGLELETMLGQSIEVKRRRPRARRILLHTATDQTARLVQRDLVGGQALVHVVSEVLLPLRDPAQAAKAAKRRQKCGLGAGGRHERWVAAGTEAASNAHVRLLESLSALTQHPAAPCRHSTQVAISGAGAETEHSPAHISPSCRRPSEPSVQQRWLPPPRSRS